MPVSAGDLPAKPCLVRVAHAGRDQVALWSGGRLNKLSVGLDELLRLTVAEMRAALEETVGSLDLDVCELLAPVASQEVWACGVTYSRSREARMEESSSQDVYAKVYEAERPELFFKSAGWRVAGHGGEAGVRPKFTTGAARSARRQCWHGRSLRPRRGSRCEFRAANELYSMALAIFRTWC